LSIARLFSALVSDTGSARPCSEPYGPDERHRLDIYTPAGARELRPIVMFFYGGGWRQGHRSSYGFVGAALAAHGFTAVIPDYRLYPAVAFPTFVADGARAYCHVTQTLAKAGRPVILMGHSAGAYIAALLALDRRYIAAQDRNAGAPAGWIGLAGPYAFDPTTWPSTRAIFASAARSPDQARPVSFAQAGAPPALLMHGLRDRAVKPWNSREMAAALRSHGAGADLIEYGGLGHIGLLLALSRPFRWRANVVPAVLEFLAPFAA